MCGSAEWSNVKQPFHCDGLANGSKSACHSKTQFQTHAKAWLILILSSKVQLHAQTVTHAAGCS